MKFITWIISFCVAVVLFMSVITGHITGTYKIIISWILIFVLVYGGIKIYKEDIDDAYNEIDN